MIKRIIRFSAENRFLVLGAVAVLIVLAGYTLRQIRLDALPDLSDTQVIVYSRWDRSPDILEDQVTYPIIANLLGAPKVKAIRGYSDVGFSYVYVIFQDGTDLYWARSRVLEYLSKIQSRLPEGVHLRSRSHRRLYPQIGHHHHPRRRRVKKRTASVHRWPRSLLGAGFRLLLR